MAGIVGTITNLSDFLSKTQVCLSVKPNDPQQQIICLEADRKYSIPAFQREVRWDDNNLKMLLYDLSRSSKFLGNIILTIKSDHTCEIIDGQQRTTEVERFADRFYANPDSQYLTVVASPQDQAVVVYEGIDFFDSYQREHKGDEK